MENLERVVGNDPIYFGLEDRHVSINTLPAFLISENILYQDFSHLATDFLTALLSAVSQLSKYIISMNFGFSN